MSVSSVSSTGAQQLWQILAASSQNVSNSETGVISTGTTTESLDLSEPGKLFSQLQELSESDPEKFKTVMTDIATQIQEAAESSSDENESGMLMKVAEDFQSAAESGDLSEALPKGPPPQGPPPQGPPPSDVSGNAAEWQTGTGSQSTEGMISAYTQTQKQGSGGFSSVLNIIGDVLDKYSTS